MTAVDLRSHIREVENFPTPGVGFKDITPLLADPVALRQTIADLSAWVAAKDADVVLVEEGLSSFPLQGRTGKEGAVDLGPISPGRATASARARSASVSIAARCRPSVIPLTSRSVKTSASSCRAFSCRQPLASP